MAEDKTDIQYEPHLKTLWELAGEIGTLAECNSGDMRYRAVYEKLSEALDVAEQHGLIRYPQEL